MEITQIETFLAVAALGGFHRAAAALRMSQPAVSARIKALEQSLGVSLFARGPGGLALSAAGRSLKPHAEQLLQTATLARQAIQELEPANGHPLLVAAALTVCTYFLPEVLSRFRKECPGVMVTLHSRSLNSKEVLDMILSEEAELGLARSLYHPQVETVNLSADSLVLVGHPTQRLRRKRPSHLSEVAEWPLIFFDRGSSDWTLTHDLFRNAGLVPNMVLEVEVIETAKKMVERGLGLAFLPYLAVAHDIRQGTLIAVAIDDAEPVRRTLDAVHLRRLPLRAEAQAFLHLAKSVANEVVATTKALEDAGRKLH
jgi:DNA-binding transcriptional LysR family regulator